MSGLDRMFPLRDKPEEECHACGKELTVDGLCSDERCVFSKNQDSGELCSTCGEEVEYGCFCESDFTDKP